MGKLSEWSVGQAAWVGDALSRAANCDEIKPSDAQAVANRVAKAQGLAIDEETTCNTFDESCLAVGAASTDRVLLCSIGPLSNVDRLANDQQLKFALNGVTLVFGENGSGKSGYARALRKLCTARVPVALQGNVFATEPQPAPTIAFTYRIGDDAAIDAIWSEGEAPPAALAGLTFLDTENARVYVEGETEILFLPAEVQCLTRLGQLYASASAICHSKAQELSARYAAPFGGSFEPSTVAGKVVSRLIVSQAVPGLPLEADIRAAAQWSDGDDEKLTDLRLQLGQSPKIQAERLRKLANAAQQAGDILKALIDSLSDEKLAEAQSMVAALATASITAETLAAEQIGGQPIAATGTDAWRALFQYARKFAAEASVVPLDRDFAVGDPCPLCQRGLDQVATDRLNAFDAFVKGEATKAVDDARREIENRVKSLSALVIEPESIRSRLADPSGTEAQLAAIANQLVEMADALRTRRQNTVNLLNGKEHTTNPPIATAGLSQLREQAQAFNDRAESLEKSGGVDDAAVKQEMEMRDCKALYDRLTDALTRREGLSDRHRYLKCIDALNTRPVSMLASTLRAELVTPELKKRIQEELEQLGLSYIPLRFREASKGGRSFFEMSLDTTYQSEKEAVLSEGEQRGLAIACFLADSHVAESKNAIIVDDPVNSLDHQRIRKVAQRFVREASKGRQVVIFTHNVLFYQEVLRSCAEASTPVPAAPCVIQKSAVSFGVVTMDDQPWIAKKVKDRERALEAKLKAIPDDLSTDSDEFRSLAKDFYTDLRETWERAVEEVVLGGVVERFGTDVKTQSLKGVEVTDDDYRLIFFAMKRVSERSGHDQAAGRQIDTPDKSQMEKNLLELRGFVGTRRKAREALDSRRRALETAPKAIIA